MRFIINSQVLYRNLSALSGVIGTSNNVPIISCFHFELEENTLTVKATNIETTLIATIELENAVVEGISRIAIPAKFMLDILKSFDDVPLTLSVNPTTFEVTLVSGEGQYEIAGQNADLFPALPAEENVTQTVMPASVLCEAIGKTIFAASNDELRQQMSGIFCEMTPEDVTFVATDAHKLVRYRRSDLHAEESVSFILPKKPIALVKNLLMSNKEDSEVIIRYNNINVFFEFENFRVVTKLIEGKYPNYEAAIPRENPNKLVLDRNTFLNTLRRVSLFANKSTYQVRISISSNRVEISTEDVELSNAAHETIPCSYEGDPMDIGFNAKFLSEMVSNLDTESILIEMSQPKSAGILFPMYNEEETHYEDILMLVMPVMLANA